MNRSGCMRSKINSKKIKKNIKRIKGQKIHPNKLKKYLKVEVSKERKKIDTTTYIIIIIFILAISLIISMITIPNISFKNKNLQIRYNTKYNLKDYKAKNLFKDYSKQVTIKDNINKNKIGQYEAIYTLKIGLISITKTRKIEVIDDVKPEIKLNGNTTETVCPNQEYKEPGYTAIDEYDGDLTKKVKVKIDKDKATYKIKDNSGNTNTITRTIKYEDTTKPQIELKSSAHMTVYIGNSYSEPGYTATDNCDGDLTSKVEVSGNVDNNTEGTYTINYKVKDSHNNEEVVTRTITVKKWNIIRPSGGGNGRGIVYLTFDDGPNPGTTDTILNILKEEGIQATFFVTGAGPDYLIQREFNEGHTVALHTDSHSYSYVYSSVDNYFNDLNKVSNRVERLTGQKSMIIRFPGGSSNTVSRFSPGIMTTLTSEVKKRGYHYFDWNVDSGDAAGASTNGVYANVVNNISLSRENVVLMHDIKWTTTEALRNIIRFGKENGFTFSKITYDTVMVTHGVNN